MRAGVSILVFLITSFVFQACTRELELPVRDLKSKIVLVGELTANEKVNFRAGKSIPVTGSNLIVFEPIDQLQVSLGDGAMTIPLSIVSDTLTSTMFTVGVKNDHVVAEGKTYTVSGGQGNLSTVTANVNIPKSFKAAVDINAATKYGTEDAVRFTINIDDEQEDNYYVIECLKQAMDVQAFYYDNGQWVNTTTDYNRYLELKQNGNLQMKYDTTYIENYERMSVYTNDINTHNLIENNSQSAFRRILLPDRNFKGSRHATQIFANKNMLQSFAKGRILVLVKSVSKDYYTFLKQYESYANTGFNSVEIAPNLTGNIQGGLGVLGGVYSHKFYYQLDSWEF